MDKEVCHTKSGRIYQLLNDNCKVKINGEWVDAVCYKGTDKNTGEMKWFIREKSDFNNHFTSVRKK